jgi:type I restriction-modification system DNA methylase subunit
MFIIISILFFKALSAKYDQEVKAITEMERKSPASNQEDQVKGNYTITFLKLYISYDFDL